ncbi:cilia- and flagella-associated protein 46-like isoform X3 [Onychostoma macrolepis]|uniref:cilia- and flagella-associated protein 46-like isoform X3 n=1 Tax=Onychostoma macrolepis TaxID=369639 RepID=UPI00272B54E0|nr:cilia- and flagella-associated protein 46-like isoform X3 [Onychostoma macrolepis]
MDLRIRQYLSKAQEKGDAVYVRKAYELIRASAPAASDGRSLSELRVLCAEQSLQLGCWEITEDCLMMYLEGKPPANQFLCRAYLCQGQLISSRSINTAEDLDKAVMYYLKAIEIAKDKSRYHFLVFNASLLYLQSVRRFLRPGQRRLLVSSLTQVLKALEEVQDPDHTWRAELMLHLVECLLDAGKRKEAAVVAKVTSDFIQSHKPELYPRLFSIQARHNLMDVSEMLNDGNPKLLVMYKIQKLKHAVDVGEVKRDDAATLKQIFLLLTQSSEPKASDLQASSPPPDIHRSSAPPNIISASSGSSPPPFTQSISAPPSVLHSSPSSSCSSSVCLDQGSSIPLTDRVELLLDLAFLSLRLQHHQTASDCLKELRATDVTVGQRVMTECVQCELELNKHREGMENYSRSSVELRLSVITGLDALLQTALKQADARATQAVCVCQWNACLPLLQHNLRKRVQKPLLTLARALEHTDSLLLDVLCRVHAELAAIDEENEKLDSAMKHLQKALELDPDSEHLSSSLHLLQLRSSVHSAPTRPEERAAKLIQQAKEGSGREAVRKRRPLLVNAGIALAPDAFQTVLDADSKAKDDGAGDRLELLAAKAQHHSTCVQKVKGHLDGLDKSSDDKERVKLWGSLAKTARKQEVFDVCRVACRFCLLYDDGRWKNTTGEPKNRASPEQRNQTDPNTQRDLLRLLAEVHFISAEVTVLKLRSEGVELNVSAVAPDEKQTRPPEDDAHWNLYSDWIKDLSAHATGGFLRGAELGAELREDWLVVNAAVYLWNYNSWLLVTGGHRLLLPTFRRLLELLRQTGHAGEVVLLAMLCDAVAQGLIQPWCGTSVHVDQESQDAGKGGVQLPAEKTKKVRGKSVEKSGSTQGPQLDAAAVLDVKKALEVCEFALRLSSGNTEPLPVSVRKQLCSTWVCVKQLLQQQIGHKLDINDESKNEAVTAVSRVLVAVEMLRCNRSSRLMQFSVPSLSVLVQMASSCQWSDPVVELYVWTQLALFAHQTQDHDLVLTCTHNALQLEQNAAQRVKTAAYAVSSVRSVQEMLSSAAGVRGQSLILEARGHHSRYMEGLLMLQNSVSFAEQAGSWSLCMSAAGHFWNACLPLLDSRRDRRPLRGALELILKTISRTYSKHTAGRTKRASGLKRDGPVMETPDTNTGIADDDLKVWTAVVSALLHIHVDTGDWRRGLQLLDESVRETPHTEHRLALLKQRVLLKARLGESVLLDMQRVSNEGEMVCAQMWRRAALCAKDTAQRLTCYQNAITALQSPGGQWQKVDVLLEFGEWLYSTHFPVTDVRIQIEWAVDMLLFTDEERVCLSDVRSVGRLERLMRSHTLLALTEERSSLKHLQHLLTAYSCSLHIWKVSMATAQEVMNDSAEGQDVRSASSRKDKERPDDKKNKQPSPVEDKPRAKAADVSLPISPEQWAQFQCPEELRQAFLSDAGPYSINSSSISAQSQTLFYLDLLVKELESLSLTPLTFAPLHLAEVIARELMQSRSQSDLYRLRIIRNCGDLGFESPFSEQLLSFTLVPADEQMRSQRAVVTQRSDVTDESDPQTVFADGDPCGGTASALSPHQLWLDKADMCLSLNLIQPAKVLLTHTHLTAQELGDRLSLAKSLQLLAVLANQEQRFVEALALLQEAQEIGGDEEFCFLLTQTLLTTVAEQEEQETHHQVCAITEQACRAFTAVLEQRPNQASVLRFFIAALQTRAAVLHQRLLSSADASVEMLSSVCDALKRAAAELLQLGYRTHSAEATLEHANTLRILAAHASSAEEKQRHLLDAFSLMKSAVSLQEQVLTDVLSVLPPHESGWRGVPAARVCVRLRLALADLALLMLDLQSAEQKRKSIARDRKSSVERALEDYMRSSADLSRQETDWSAVGRSLAQEVLTHLTAVSSLSPDCVETRARSLGMMGRCLRILAQQRDPLYPSTLWTEPDTDLEREQNQEDDEDQQVKMNEAEKKQYAGKRAELQSERRAAQRLLAQACETLSQSVSLSLHHDLPHLLPRVCSDLLECHGQFDPGSSGQYLALLQSGVCCAEMSSVLQSICCGVNESQTCALMNLRRTLLSSRGHRPDGALTAVTRELSALSKAFSHLTINPNHLRILGEMPPDFKILLLQHSEDSSVLYAGLYEKVKAAETQKGKSVTGGLICSKVVKASVHRSDLLQLHKLLQEFKDLNTQTSLNRAQEDKDGKLDDCFRALLEEMENYLNPVLSQFDFSCFSVRSPSISTTSARAKDKDEKTADKPLPDAGESVVILADRTLLEFPLEALSVLQVNSIGSVSRDLSLQVLHARLQTDEAVESDNKKEAKGGKGVKGKGDQSRGIKAVPVNRVLPPNAVPVDTHRFRYVVDAQEEDDGKQADCSSPAEIMRKTLDTYASQFTPLWEGFISHERKHSLADLEQMLMSCSAFIYSGTENFFSCVPPAKMASLNLSGCQMVFLFERGQNRVSVQKRRRSRASDGPLGSAYLFSLSGVRSVLLNQWHSSAAANAQNMRSLVDNLLRAGLTSGRAAHVLRTENTEVIGNSSGPTADESSAVNVEDVQRKTPSAFNFVIYGLPNLVVT